MAANIKNLVEAANAVVPRVTAAEVRAMMVERDVLVVDVREAVEVAASGKVAGAIHISRGVLEFRADPEAPSHDKNFDKS